MKILKYFLFIFLISLASISCKNHKNKYTIAASSSSTSNYSAAQILKKELENNSNIRLDITENLHTSKDNIISVYHKESDFAIIQNTLDYDELGIDDISLNQNIRTILPLYNQVLFIIYDEKDHQNNLYDLLKGKRVGFGEKNGGDAWLVQEVFNYLGIPDSIYTAVYGNYQDNFICDDIDISCSVTSYNNPRIVKMLNEGKNRIFSFEQASNINSRGSAVNGIGLKNTTISEFIIPKNSYGRFPKEPVLTICTKAVLIGHKSIEEDVTYEIIKEILNHKTLIANSNPIYDLINENFNTHELRFPMHLGVKMFLDRDKPSFLEKYAEVMALIITIMALLFGGVSSFRNWQKMKKKDRIDVYYQDVIDLDIKILNAQNDQELKDIENKLFIIRDNAFDQLIKEQLIADESFNIFLRLIEVSMTRVKDLYKKK